MAPPLTQPEAPKLQKSIFSLCPIVLKNGFSKFGSNESGDAGLNWFPGCTTSNTETLLCFPEDREGQRLQCYSELFDHRAIFSCLLISPGFP